jgi:hypothetical protein
MRKSKVNSPNAHLLKDEAWLRTKYIDENLSFRMISALIQCSSLTVSRAIRKAGIDVKPKHITYGDIVYPDRKGANSPTWKGGTHRCPDCNIEIGYRYSKNNKPVRCKTCANKFYRGENNACWKPKELHNTVLNNRIRHSADAKDWRNAVFVRDGYMCKICGENTRTLAAHHLDAFEIFPEKRFDVDNGVTLCGVHHTQFHRLFGFGKNTAEQFQEYVEQMTVELVY